MTRHSTSILACALGIIVDVPTGLVVHPSLPVKNARDANIEPQ